jgi:hypothetical protein
MNPVPDELYDLILASLYGIADQAQESRLAEILESDPSARTTYVDFLMLYAHLHRRKGACLFLGDAGDSILNENAWRILAEQEKTAEAVPVERTEEESVPKLMVKPAVQARVSKLSIYSLILSTAALIFMIAYAQLSPIGKAPLVGRLSRTVQAKWQDASGQIAQGCDLYAGPMNLLEGYAEITFDAGATVIVQAPSQFTLESGQQMFLQQGQVVASMRGGAKQAFVVRSPTACVVDYGTEFGVAVQANGQTETYVYEGQVQIRDSSDPVKFMKSMLLKAGQGAVADPESRLLSQEVNPHGFIRSEELNARQQAHRGSSYHRWKTWTYRLHRDPSLVAHYFYEPVKDAPDRLVNVMHPGQPSMQGTFGDENKGKPSWTEGRWPQKQGVLFERRNHQAIVIPPDPTLSFYSPLTLSTWVYFPSAERWGGHLISCRENQQINYQFSLFDNKYDYDYQRNRFEFRQYDGTGKAGLYSQPFIPTAGTWYHFAMVYDGAEIRFYVNGALFQAVSYKGRTEASPAEIVLGAVKIDKYVLEEGDFDGIVDELLIFKRCLSESEILDIYENGKP